MHRFKRAVAGRRLIGGPQRARAECARAQTIIAQPMRDDFRGLMIPINRFFFTTARWKRYVPKDFPQEITSRARPRRELSARAEGWPALCVYLSYTSEHNLNTFEHGFFRALKKMGCEI